MCDPIGPMLYGMTYIVRPAIEPENNPLSFALIFATSSTQRVSRSFLCPLLGDSTSTVRLDMKTSPYSNHEHPYVARKLRPTNSEINQLPPGRHSKNRLSIVPHSTGKFQTAGRQ